MAPEKTIMQRWQALDAKRTAKLYKSRLCSAITIPTILPMQSISGEIALAQQYSSVQSRGVTSLASKILSVLIPLNDTPFFSFGLKNGKEPTIEIQEYLAKLALQVYKKLVSNNLREVAYLAMQHLIIVGDVMIIMENDYSFRIIRLDQFVIRRDVSGAIKEVIYLEFIPPSNKDPIDGYSFQSGVTPQPGYTTVYIRCCRGDDNSWKIEKEVDNEIIDSGFYDVLPFVFLRWTAMAGEDYGRSHVEDIYADISSLESYTRAMKQGMSAGSTFFMGIDPAGITEVDDLSTAQNGQWVAARKQDVYVISPGETMKPQMTAVSMAVETMRKEVGSGFLLQTASMPTGDRVTATAIRAIGNELETILGGTFSAIAREFMVPVIERTIYLMLQSGDIDPNMAGQFDNKNGILNIEILTGLQSLSKESDLQRLMQMGEMIRNLPPEAIASFKWESYAHALIYSLGFDPENWVKTKEEQEKEAAAAQAAMEAAEQKKMMGQAAANIAQDAAKQQVEQHGTESLTPELMQQSMGGLGQAMNAGQSMMNPQQQGPPI